MSLKNSNTTANYLEWNTAVNLVHRLFRDGKYQMSLFIGCGIFFGLRCSDLLRMRWDMLLEEPSFEIIEKKTQKRREVKINKNFQKHIVDCYNALQITDKAELCFKSPRNGVYSIQRINVMLKDVKAQYGLKIRNFSSHSLRKTFGRNIYERADANGQVALAMLSELFNHSSVSITRRYLGITQEELLGCYDLLEF